MCQPCRCLNLAPGIDVKLQVGRVRAARPASARAMTEVAGACSSPHDAVCFCGLPRQPACAHIKLPRQVACTFLLPPALSLHAVTSQLLPSLFQQKQRHRRRCGCPRTSSRSPAFLCTLIVAHSRSPVSPHPPRRPGPMVQDLKLSISKVSPS